MGRRIRDFEEYRVKGGGTTAYRATLGETLKWLSELYTELYEDKELFQDTLRGMIAADPVQRPSAEQVLGIMQRCKTSDGLIRCGAACCHES